MRKWAALAAVGVVAVSAVAGTALADKGDDVFHRQQVTWTSCDVGDVPLRCAEVRVPVDWSRPDGDTISLAVSRHQATGDRRGSLLLDPGGPGASGVDFVPGAVGGLGAELVAVYDLVGWDPRGSGRSHPLTCPAEADTAFAAVDSSPDTLDERLAYEQAASTWARACQRESGPLFAHVDSLSTVRDMDVLRAVLGEERLDYAGCSYGTVLGTWYADLFPRRVGRMVLDSAADPTLDLARWMEGNTTAKEDALNGYLASCADRAGCPFADADAARTWLLELLRRNDAEPLRAPDGTAVTQAMLYDVVYGGLIQPRGWPGLDMVLTGLRAGDATAAAGQAQVAAVTIANAAPLCLDLPDDRTAREVMADAERAERRSLVFARTTVAGTNTVCAGWPVATAVHPHRVTAPRAAPILVVGITHDTAGPYSWSRSLAAQLVHGRLLTYDGHGHGAVIASPCARAHENRYLVDGVLPEPGTVCRD